MKPIRRLPLKGLYNCRDLGGIPVAGGQTKFGVFIRSEGPCELPGEDLDSLHAYGVTASIDLRGAPEREVRPSDLSLDDRFIYHALPLRHAESAARTGLPREFKPWGEEYIEMIGVNQKWACHAMELAAANDGALLYHCTTGKDRTGIMSALLLSVAGAEHADIAADYCVSELYLTPVYERMKNGTLLLNKNQQLVMDDKFFRTKAEYMLQLLGHLDEAYGGAVGFLKESGVDDITLDAIRHKFVEK